MKARILISLAIMGTMALSVWQCDQPKDKESQKTSETGEQTKTAELERKKPELVYDKNGNVIERHAISYRKSDNSIRSKDSYYYTFDDNNNLIKEIKESYDPAGDLKYKNVNKFTYNNKNQKIEQIFYSYNENDELQRQARNTFKYDENGYKIEDIGYYEDGTIKSRIILDPDENGFLRSEEFINYNHDETKSDHKKYYYNEYGLEKTEDLMEK